MTSLRERCAVLLALVAIASACAGAGERDPTCTSDVFPADLPAACQAVEEAVEEQGLGTGPHRWDVLRAELSGATLLETRKLVGPGYWVLVLPQAEGGTEVGVHVGGMDSAEDREVAASLLAAVEAALAR